MPGAEVGFWTKLRLRSRSNLYFALAFLPRHQREAFRDVYRFLRGADDVVDEADAAARPAAARALAAWQAELERIYGGAAVSGEAARLAAVVRRFKLPRRYFEAILAGIEDDLSPAGVRYATWSELEAYCEAIGSSLGHLCLAIFTDGDAELASDPAALTYAHDLGAALQLANIVRDVAEDARRGRIYLPADDLARFGVATADLLAGRMSAGCARLLAFEKDRVVALITSARAALAERPALARPLVVAEIWADVYLAQLEALAARGYDVFADAGPLLRRRRKLVLALVRWVRTRLGSGSGPRAPRAASHRA